MIIEKKNINRSVFKNTLSILKNKKVLIGSTVFILYTILTLSVGYVLQRHAFYGSVVKPVLLKNFKIADAYFKSFFVDSEKITIDIKHKDYLKLAHMREEALKVGLVRSSGEGWVPATILHDGKRVKADIRLKGTGDEHWIEENVWSLKIKIKNGDTLFGMKRFALNRPITRAFMNEWFWHKLLRYSGLISLRFDFIEVTINGKALPIYAIEENFGKRLIENNNLKEGPVFRADLNYPFWWYYNQNKSHSLSKAISVYQLGSYSKNMEFMKLVHLAESRIEAYRRGSLSFSKVFDVNKMAKLVALTDLVQSRHSLFHNNIRFYLNPVTGLIEPIAYDGTIPLSRNARFDFSGQGRKFIEQGNQNPNNYSSEWPWNIFQDKIFFKKYIESLEEISDKKFFDQFFLNIKEEAEEKEKILNKSFPYYEFDEEKFYKNRKNINEQLRPSKSLSVYYEGSSKKERILYLDIANTFVLPVEVLGISLDGNNIIKPLKESVVQAKSNKLKGDNFYDITVPLPRLDNIKGELLKEAKNFINLMPMFSSTDTKVNEIPKNIEFSGLEYNRIKFKIPKELEWSDNFIHRSRVISRVFGASFKTSNEIIPWARHEDIFLQSPNIKTIPFMSVEEEKKIIRIKPGKWIVKQDIIIPAGYQVAATEGTHLKLINGAKILSYSSVEFVGTEAQPIIISSEGNSGQGIVVMKANKKSLIKHTIFDGLSNPMKGGWVLTGAVTFYESPVEFLNIEFRNIQSEDGLNIIRSEFTLDGVAFHGMKSDALDSDFSNGVMRNVSFLNCGNDALDASGSKIHVESIFFNGIRDKGVSAGEKSHIFIDKLDGKNSRIIVASKDQSEVFVKNAILENSQIGFTAFQKKNEFGPGSIVVETLQTKNLETLFLIEEGSTLKIGGNSITDRVKGVGKLLYGR
jgi:spore coat protein CotH